MVSALSQLQVHLVTNATPTEYLMSSVSSLLHVSTILAVRIQYWLMPITCNKTRASGL